MHRPRRTPCRQEWTVGLHASVRRDGIRLHLLANQLNVRELLLSPASAIWLPWEDRSSPIRIWLSEWKTGAVLNARDSNTFYTPGPKGRIGAAPPRPTAC